MNTKMSLFVIFCCELNAFFKFAKLTINFVILGLAISSVCAFGGGGARSGSAGVYGGSRVVGNARSGGHISGLGNEYDRVNFNKKSKDNNVLPKATGRNISTPQIVFILTLICSLGFAGYYFIQFYPFICSSEKKYDVMSRASVTPTHSREFEYDESTSSATKSTNASYSNEHDV